jgi:ABC-2 type transport system ATP-binding protein
MTTMQTASTAARAESAAAGADHAITVRDLTKRYGTIEALRGADLTVPRGSLFGLLGPNGAGKSTLIKAIVGALRPTSGEVRTLGLDPLRDRAAVRSQIGYMPQSPALYDDLSARENIAFFGAAHAGEDLAGRVDAVLAFTELTARANDAVGQFSGGMKRRISLAAALIHRPPLLILDEPTAAVDPGLRARFWQQFRELAAAGTTLLISTHLMDEALLCDTVAVQRRGQIIAVDTPRALIERGKTHLTIDRAGHTEEQTVGGQPTDLAAALHPYGLAEEVRAIKVDADSLETVILNMVREDEK